MINAHPASGARLATGPVSWGVWRNSKPWIPWPRFLDEVVLAGYSAIELGTYGFLPTNLAQLKGELAERGLSVAGGAVVVDMVSRGAWPASRAIIDQQAERVAELGSPHLIVVSSLSGGREKKEPSDFSWPRFFEAANRIADHIRSNWGLRMEFHPHVDTVVENEVEIDRFLSNMDQSQVGLCLDVGHLAYRGADPISVLRSHVARVEYLHLKAVDAAIRDQVTREDLTFEQAVELGIFVEPNDGVVDFAELGRAIREVGFEGWATVEQDAPNDLNTTDALGRATRSHRYLRCVGFS